MKQSPYTGSGNFSHTSPAHSQCRGCKEMDSRAVQYVRRKFLLSSFSPVSSLLSLPKTEACVAKSRGFQGLSYLTIPRVISGKMSFFNIPESMFLSAAFSKAKHTILGHSGTQRILSHCFHIRL